MIGSLEDMCLEFENRTIKIEFFDVYKIIIDHKLKLKNFDLGELHKLYLSHSSDYDLLISKFKRFAEDKEIIIFNMVNFIHPDWLQAHLPNKTLIYGCIDDPITSYSRTSGSIFAYDGVFYFSLGYDEHFYMEEKLISWGAKETHFWPPNDMKFDYYNESFYIEVEESFNKRNNLITYVGLLYGAKYDRLVSLKRRLGDDFRIYGRWPLQGWAGLFAPLKGRKFYPYKVESLNDLQRKKVYLSTLASLNLHLSSDNREFGNLRVFETIRHGLLLISDKGGKNSQNLVFEDGKNALFYETEKELLEKIDFIRHSPKEAIDIARRGFELAKEKFDINSNFRRFISWCLILNDQKKNSVSH